MKKKTKKTLKMKYLNFKYLYDNYIFYFKL